MRKFQGVGGAEGLALGTAVVKKSRQALLSADTIEDAEKEVLLLDAAIRALALQLQMLYDKTLAQSGEEAAELIESYQMILLDTRFFDGARKRIREEKLNWKMAVSRECSHYEAVFGAMDDPYLQERFQDIQGVCNDLIAVDGAEDGNAFPPPLTGAAVIIADTLTPTDTVKLDKDLLRGFVTERGGVTSHAVILAKALGIPAVVGIQGIANAVPQGASVMLNGTSGELILEPDAESLAAFEKQRRQALADSTRFSEEPAGAARTADGHGVLITVNSGDADSLARLDPGNCDGVGLFRTEFLYMKQDTYPTEEEQFQVYRSAAEKLQGKELIIRTLDIGGDKALAYMDLPKEENPFLGYRAVRICLDRPEIFKTQLRAILRASAYGKLRIMFPMIVSHAELTACKRYVALCKEELEKQGLAFDRDVSVGIMVETPAALFVLDQLAGEADFFSVGTNDLVQYLTATDRGNEKVQNLYDPHQISVLRALREISRVARETGLFWGVCGETASMNAMIPFLIGCGVQELSVSMSAVGRVRYLVRRLSREACRAAVEHACGLYSAEEARAYLENLATEALR